jgi:uncharacterized protein
MFIINRFLILLVRFYQLAISPILRPQCSYSPSCSQYMIDAIQQWGIKGVWMGLKRIGRCHPWGGFGYDPVPKKPTK